MREINSFDDLNAQEAFWYKWLMANDPDAKMESQDDFWMFIECDVVEPFKGLNNAQREEKLKGLLAKRTAELKEEGAML